MKKLVNFSLFAALSLFAVLANAGAAVGGVPEMDASTAIIGLGLLSGIVALIAERRRK